MAGDRGWSADAQLELKRFQLLSTAAGRYKTPSEVDWSGALAVEGAATVGAALHAHKQLDLENPPPLDATDHWYRASVSEVPAGAAHVLVFEGLATLADVWLDGEHVLHSENMFTAHELDVTGRVREGSELVLCFRALAPHLGKRRPRPRWRTRIVDAQQLRWVRTSLIGRTPGFCPNLPVVGPYRPIRLEARSRFHVRTLRLQTARRDEQGSVSLAFELAALSGVALPTRAELIVEGAAGHGRLALTAEGTRFSGELSMAQVAPWWPHTHGEQPRSRARLRFQDGHEVELGSVAFRSLEIDRGADGRGFGLVVNGEPVFARGACWTTDDLLALSSANLRRTLELVRSAGMNMLRIGGTTAYESDAFYELCDELGILVFQDFMFANMDYPGDDAAFTAEVEREVVQLLGRIGARPCLAVLCGGSEVEQQVSMLGMPRELWHGALFYELLPRLCAQHAPGVAYVPSSPTGGDLPFQSDEGICHYYGVGAYLRPLEDARRANVRFAAECLAFANVPCTETIEGFMRDLEMPFHHPRWKQRVPRDRGVGWDFEDVRDHYIRTLFACEPRELRYADPERYLALGHAAVAAVMQASYEEWRRSGSSCRGALVFWLKDFWDGAGWGVIDASSRPKSAYFALKRAFQPVALGCTDEGLNGLALHAINETPHALPAQLDVILYRAGEVQIAESHTALTLAPRANQRVRVEGLLAHFTDTTYAYRFGPPTHDLVFARLRAGERVLARAFHLPLGHARAQELDLGLSAQVEVREGVPGLLIKTRRFAQCVSLDVRGYLPADDGFHLEPGGERWVALTPYGAKPPPVRGAVKALNAYSAVNITSPA